MSGFSNRQKAKFFQSVDHIVSLVLDYKKGYEPITFERCICDLPFPCSYGEVKWALKKLTGEFPTKETILKYCATDEQIREFNEYEQRAMSDYR